MDCGPNEPLCQLVNWLASHSHAIQQTLEHLDNLWDAAGRQILKFLKEHGEKLIAIASFSFGVWRWWIYRERILHKRLEEYIRESDARLGPAAIQTAQAILRPGRTAALPQPAFAIELEDILVQSRWASLLRFSAEGQAERKLGRALRGIRKRQQIARAAVLSLVEQQTQVHLLAGAIAASRARRKPDRHQAWRYDHAALREFRQILQVPTHDRDTLAKESEAFQLLRLGRKLDAFQAYLDLENIAETALKDQQQRDLTIARAKRFRAQILQSNAADAGAGAAWGLIANNQDPQCAVQLRGRYGPFTDWDGIEHAETHFISAWVACKLGFGSRETAHLSTAEAAYGDVLAHLPKRLWFVPLAKKRLREEAREGLKRIERAKTGDYDKQWLLV